MSDEKHDPLAPYNPSLARLQRKNKNEVAYTHSRKQEKNTKARLTAGRAIPASGAKFRKGDVEVPNAVRIECKATRHSSFSITQEMISKIENAALASNQIPMVEVEFVDKKGKPIYSVCVMKRHDVTALINRVSDAEADRSTDKRSVGRPKRNDHWRTKNK